jgi:protein-L-isoaspartate(D-aspartate) O-methyltransferase
MAQDQARRIEQARRAYAQDMAASAGGDARLEAAFAAVPREAFLPPGPWLLSTGHGYVHTPDADPIHLYRDVLIGLDPVKGINNGEPRLHARWLGLVAPRPGETVVQVGAGTGYYTALLATLVAPGGTVTAYEIDAALAAAARDYLTPYPGVSVVAADATAVTLAPADIVYVSAAVIAPPRRWLDALRPGGRLICPWQATRAAGITLLATRRNAGFEVRLGQMVWFIPCTGASDPSACLWPVDSKALGDIRALYLTAERAPDDSAVAIYRYVWFSTRPLE